MRTVGISHKTRYWQHYCFSNPPAGHRYVRMVDIPWHMAGIRTEALAHTKLFLPFRKADIYHTYNSVVANARPWVIEVESYIPRYETMSPNNPLYKWAIERLAGKYCKALIFTSQNTMELNRLKLVEAGVDERKMHVVYRAVEQFQPAERTGDKFRILFAGNGFYRKGGIELLKAFKLLDRKDVSLEIISGLAVDWGITATREEIQWTERTIADDPRITLHRQLPHDQVIEHMRRADVFVATTFADPFNNTVLEAMGTGLPIISSDVDAVPEMVQHDVNGWLLPVLERKSEEIAEDIAGRLRRLMDDTSLRLTMGAANSGIINERFTLNIRNAALGPIYDEALGELPLRGARSEVPRA